MFLKRVLFLFVSVTIVLLNNCSELKTGPYPYSHTANKISFTIISSDSTLSSEKEYVLEVGATTVFGANFSPGDSSTFCWLAGDLNSSPSSIIMSFSGNRPGIYEWEGILSRDYINIQISPNHGDEYYSSEGQTEITKYGKIGETVEGSFSGSFFKRQIPAIDTVMISGGFVLLRNEDK